MRRVLLGTAGVDKAGRECADTAEAADDMGRAAVDDVGEALAAGCCDVCPSGTKISWPFASR